LLNQIRYQQQYRQLRTRIDPGVGDVATYGERDGVTGYRSIQTADGGEEMGRYLSNSEPIGVMPIARFSTIGLTGYISQKPY
jgi:hypothetical protein